MMDITERKERGQFWPQRKLRLLIIAAFLFTARQVACSRDECEEIGDTRCFGNTIKSCEGGEIPVLGYNVWTAPEECDSGTFCVESALRGAFCALSKEPDPQCNMHRGYCEGNVLISCSYGFVDERHDCSETQRTCVVAYDAGATCALSTTPDPRCRDHFIWGPYAECDGKTLLHCFIGYATGAETCENTCVSSDSDLPFCSDFSEPEPRCTEALLENKRIAICVNGAEANCKSGYAQVVLDCAAIGLSCQQVDGGGTRCYRAEE